MNIPVSASQDVIRARNQARAIARQVGFSALEATLIATAVSELARNLLQHAGGGSLEIELLPPPHDGIRVVTRDQGPGIPDVPRAVRGGFSTSGSSGVGLAAVRKAMDVLHIDSSTGRGTTIVAEKRLKLPKWG